MVELSSLVFFAASMLSILCKNLLIAELIKLIGYSRLRKVVQIFCHYHYIFSQFIRVS